MSVYELPIGNAGVLQPWGLMNIDRIHAEKDVLVPKDWLLTDRKMPLEERRKSFEKWRDETLELINRSLWPRYDHGRQVWIGESARFMEELTKTDLLLMLDMQHPPTGIRQFDRIPDSPLRTLTIPKHRTLFVQEDGSGIFGSFAQYNRDGKDIPMSGLCFDADLDKQDPINYQFKTRLQRPRAMQTALRFGNMNFEYRQANSSISPSMCSGHCLQGVMEVGGALDRLLEDGVPLTVQQLEAIGQWGVDIGDRRVMAGVHYPSDNICSWLLFLTAAEFIYKRQSVKYVIGYAIRKLSFVYRELHRWRREGKGGKVYAAALEELDARLPPENFRLESLLTGKPVPLSEVLIGVPKE